MAKENSINPEVGRRLKEAIEESKYRSQAEVARKLNYSAQEIYNLVKSRNKLTMELAMQLGDLLNVNPYYLLCESNKKTKVEKDFFDSACEFLTDFLDFFKKRTPEHINIIYDRKKEVFKIVDDEKHETKCATFHQLEVYCRYLKDHKKDKNDDALFELFWELI